MTFICQGQILTLTNKCRICHVHTVPAYFFSGISHEFQKCRYFFLKKVKKLFVFYLYSHRRFFVRSMNNKIIIQFGFRRVPEYQTIQTSVSVICLSFASADNADLHLNNSEYPAKPHPIILKHSCDI